MNTKQIIDKQSKDGYKYLFAVGGIVRVTKNFHTDREALEYCERLRRQDRENWKVYNERGDLVYGVAIMR